MTGRDGGHASADLILPADAAGFLELCEGFLLAAEAEYNLMIGIARDARARPERIATPPFFAVALRDGRVAGAAVHTPPYPLAITAFPPSGMERLASSLIDGKRDPAGVVGPPAVAENFAGVYCAAAGDRRHRVAKKMRIYRLDRVKAPHPRGGFLRAALPGDLALAAEWTRRFHNEVRERGVDHEAVARNAIADGRLFFLLTDRPVSMGAWVRDTGNARAVGLVYTPPEERNRGYASACVAALCEEALSRGSSFCVLYADLANPTTNRIYQNIGFKGVAEAAHLVFESGAGGADAGVSGMGSITRDT